MTTDKLVNNVQAPTYPCVVFWHHCSKALVAVCSFGSATETWILEDFVQAIKHVHWVLQNLLATDYIWKVVEATKVWGYILKPMEDTNFILKSQGTCDSNTQLLVIRGRGAVRNWDEQHDLHRI